MRPVDTASAVDEPRAVPLGRSRRRRWLLLGASVAILLGLGLWWLSSAGPAPLTSTDVDQAVQRGIEEAAEEERNTPPDATTAYQTITPSLVTVTSQRPGAGSRPASPRPAWAVAWSSMPTVSC